MAGQQQLKKRNLFLVAGGSRLGANIASVLSQRGKEVALIDVQTKAFRKLSPDFSGYMITGDASDITVLEQAGVETAQVLIASTDDDNTNIMIGQIAKTIFQVPHVIIRLYSPEVESIGGENGVRVVYPYKLSVGNMEKMLGEMGCLL